MVGITHVAVLAIHAIGHAYAQVAGISGRSGVKQTHRILGNCNMVVDKPLKGWVILVVGVGKEIVVALARRPKRLGLIGT